VTHPRLYPRIALLILTALNLLNYIDRSVLFAVQPLVQSEFHLNDAQIGRVTTLFFVFYTVAAPLMGPLADRYSRRMVIVLGAFAWSGVTLLTAVTHSYLALLIRHTLVGVGEASFVTVSPTFVVDLFPEQRRGRVLGVFYLAIPVGTALGYLIGGYFGTRFGWRAPFYIAGAPGFLLAFIMMFIPNPNVGSSIHSATRRNGQRFLGLVRNPAFWTATLGMAAMTFSLGGLQVWMPTFLSRVRGYSLDSANKIFGAIIAFDGIIASLAGGWLGDRLLKRKKSAYYLVSAVSLAMGVPAMMMALFTSGSAMLPALLVAAFLVLLNTAPLNAAIINSVGAHIRATAIAVNLFVIHFLGDALSPWVIGKISDRSSLQSGFISAVVAIALSSAILFYGMRFAPPLRIGEPSTASGAG